MNKTGQCVSPVDFKGLSKRKDEENQSHRLSWKGVSRGGQNFTSDYQETDDPKLVLWNFVQWRCYLENTDIYNLQLQNAPVVLSHIEGSYPIVWKAVTLPHQASFDNFVLEQYWATREIFSNWMCWLPEKLLWYMNLADFWVLLKIS